MTTVAAPAGRRAVVLTLAVPCVAQFMLIVDVVVVNVARPSMRDPEVSEARLQLVAVAYPLTFGSLLIVFGRAGDLFGRRHLFLTGVAVFTVTSLATGLADSEWQLVAARAAQGARAAKVSPTARPPRHRRVGKCEWTRH
jgi:MFS family permease